MNMVSNSSLLRILRMYQTRRAGRDSVLTHYKAISGWDRIEGIVFELGRLPAALNFHKKKQNRKAKARVNLPTGNWTDSEEKEEDDDDDE
jgi:hypothetical protein